MSRQRRSNNSSSNQNSKNGQRNANTGSESKMTKTSESHLSTMLSAAARISAGYPMGLKLPVGGFRTSAITYDTPKVVTPGIMTIKVAPSIGWNDSSNSPAAIAAFKLFNYTTAANSRNVPYTPSDELTVQLAISDLILDWYQLVRIYGLHLKYNAYSRYEPEQLFKALRLSDTPTSIDWSKFRYWLNQMAYAMNSLRIIPGLPFMQEGLTDISTVYADHSDPLVAQLIVVDKIGYWEFDETTYETGAALIYKQHANSISSRMTEFEDRLNALLYSDLVNRISADVEKAFGATSIGLPVVDEFYQTEFAYSELFLEMLHNTFIPGPEFTSVSTSYDIIPTIDESGVYVKHTPSFKLVDSDAAVVCETLLGESSFVPLDLMYKDVEPNVMAAYFRFHPAFKAVEIGTGRADSTFGINSSMWIPLGYNLYTGVHPGRVIAGRSFIEDGITVADTVDFVAALSTFERHPLVFAANVTGTSTSVSEISAFKIIGDQRNLTTVENETINNIQVLLAYNMFNI